MTDSAQDGVMPTTPEINGYVTRTIDEKDGEALGMERCCADHFPAYVLLSPEAAEAWDKARAPKVTTVAIRSTLTLVVEDGVPKRLDLTLYDVGGVVEHSLSDEHDDLAAQVADGTWDFPWDTVPSWLNISS